MLTIHLLSMPEDIQLTLCDEVIVWFFGHMFNVLLLSSYGKKIMGMSLNHATTWVCTWHKKG